MDCSDHEASVLSFRRQTDGSCSWLLVVLNLTPVLRRRYRIGVPSAGFWREVLNSDSEIYGGSNQGNLGGVTALSHQTHNQPFSAEFTLPPVSVTVFKLENRG